MYTAPGMGDGFNKFSTNDEIWIRVLIHQTQVAIRLGFAMHFSIQFQVILILSILTREAETLCQQSTLGCNQPTYINRHDHIQWDFEADFCSPDALPVA